MPYIPRNVSVYNELERKRGGSEFAIQVEFNPIVIREITDGMDRVTSRFRAAAESVNAAFGAYMPYSAALELGYRHYLSGRWHKARPHILPTIKANKAYIMEEVTREYGQLYMAYIQNPKSAPSQKAMQAEMEAIWQMILNGKVKDDTVSLAQGLGIEETGMHISTISGWGKAPTAEMVSNWQGSLMTKRNTMRPKMKGLSVSDRVGKRTSMRNAAKRFSAKNMR